MIKDNRLDRFTWKVGDVRIIRPATRDEGDHMQCEDWFGNRIELAKSRGGVIAVSNSWNNVIKTGVKPWPPPELVQKLYRSKQESAFDGADREIVTKGLGFYSDLQSLHSEDALTWSIFGPVIYSAPQVQRAYVKDFLALTKIEGSSQDCKVWIWRRIPHPDDLVPGGPEIDFGIQTDDTWVLGEAKWRSAVGTHQGVNRDKDQIILREEFCRNYGPRFLPSVRHFVVLGLSSNEGMVIESDTQIDNAVIHLRCTTWDAVARIETHPVADEVQKYLQWKTKNSKIE